MQIILHGGYGGHWDHAGEDNALFHKLIAAAEQADGKVMVSICAHKIPAEFTKLEQLKRSFHALNPRIKLSIAGRDNFHELLPQHKVLFLQGGNSAEHFNFMANTNAHDLTHGKTLMAGSSSGAMLLCRHGFSQGSNSVLTGKGIVDLALIPHANAWPATDYLPILQQATSSSILLLNEQQMLEFSV